MAATFLCHIEFWHFCLFEANFGEQCVAHNGGQAMLAHDDAVHYCEEEKAALRVACFPSMGLPPP